MNPINIQQIIRKALNEDLGFGDLSSYAFPEDYSSSGAFISKAEGTLAGLSIIRETYRLLDDNITVSLEKEDGDPVQPGEIIASAKGPAAVLLAGERVILNFIQHLSGIATTTRKAVNMLDHSHTRVCDTRKTLPGLRMLQKYAVRCGGGYNHRFRLDDGIMIKDNHIKAAGSITGAVREAQKQHGHMVKVEVETETREQVLEAIDAGADIIMFDNCTPDEVKEFVDLVPGYITTEVSGGITLDTIGNYKNIGVDYISLGFLTHSAHAFDISFNLEQ